MGWLQRPMMKRLFRYAGLVLAFGAAGVSAQVPDPAAAPAQQYQALLKEFSAAAPNYFQTTNVAERQAMVARVDKVTVKLMDFLEQHPKEPFALEGLTQVITMEYWLNNHTQHPGWGTNSPQAKAITQLLRDHLQSDQLVETCKRVNFGFRQECETFLRTVLEKNPHRDVQGAACLRLAQLLAGRVEKLDVLKDQPELIRRYEGLFGKDFIQELQRRDQGAVMKEAEALYEKARDKYGDVKLPWDETVGQVAARDLNEIQYFAVGKVAPELKGEDQNGQPLELSAYRGKVVLLYFWTEY